MKNALYPELSSMPFTRYSGKYRIFSFRLGFRMMKGPVMIEGEIL